MFQTSNVTEVSIKKAKTNLLVNIVSIMWTTPIHKY